jgi:hypothetical protein
MAKKYEFERRDIENTPRTRLGTAKRKLGIRSTHQRCPRCKKIRMKFGRANWYHEGRKRWQKRTEGLVCHVCIEREAKSD